MRVERPSEAVVVLGAEVGDDPESAEDAVHDAVRAGVRPGEPSRVRVVILDLRSVREPQRWLKALGPEVPDAVLRVVMAERLIQVARLLGLSAFYEWYATVEDALRGGV